MNNGIEFLGHGLAVCLGIIITVCIVASICDRFKRAPARFIVPLGIALIWLGVIATGGIIAVLCKGCGE